MQNVEYMQTAMMDSSTTHRKRSASYRVSFSTKLKQFAKTQFNGSNMNGETNNAKLVKIQTKFKPTSRSQGSSWTNCFPPYKTEKSLNSLNKECKITSRARSGNHSSVLNTNPPLTSSILPSGYTRSHVDFNCFSRQNLSN